jgi:pimeloyl-ACP methyl ester carboxylesterase
MHSPPLDPDRRRRWRRLAAGFTVMAALVSACSAGTSGGQSATPGGQSATSGGPPATTGGVAPPALEQPGVRCGGPDTQATLVRFNAADGTSLNGVLVGSGTVGVVLVHEYPDDLCGSWPFAAYLAGRGMRAFAIDVRCFGLSACPQGEARGGVIDDVAAAVAELRRRGVTRVALVGASMGGTAVLIAGTRVRPQVDAVVSVSGVPDPTSRIGIPLNAGAVLGQLAVPTMLLVATNDSVVSVEETQAMHRSVKAGAKRLEVLTDEYDGGHGWRLLTDPATGELGSVAAGVAAFLTGHTRN